MQYNVLSLFDGCSGGQQALERAGILVGKYYASELDKQAIKVTQANYPDTIQLGDVTKVNGADYRHCDILFAGFPCQDFSIAGKRAGPEGESGKLFFELLRIKNEMNPKWFLFENNQSMKREIQIFISEKLGIYPVRINSKLVSAQNRDRIYWTNFRTREMNLFGDIVSDIPQPKDRKIMLWDVLELEVDKKYFISETAMKRIFTGMPRSSTSGKVGTGPLSRDDGKTYCLDTGQTNAIQLGKSPNFGTSESDSGKAYCVTAIEPNGINGINGIRRLTEIEVERLQGMKEVEINCIFELCYDQINPLVSAVEKCPQVLKLVLGVEKTELKEFVNNVVLNMNLKHQPTENIVVQNAEDRTQRPTKKLNMMNQSEISTHANSVVKSAINQDATKASFVHQNVFINIIEGRITHCGLEEFHPKEQHFTIMKNGNNPLKMCGKEIMQFVEDVEKSLNTKKDKNSTFIMSSLLNTMSLEQMLIICYLFAKNATTGFTQNTTQQKSLLLNFKIINGYTNHVSSTQRYKMCGNGWQIDTIVHILQYLNKSL